MRRRIRRETGWRHPFFLVLGRAFLYNAPILKKEPPKISSGEMRGKTMKIFLSGIFTVLTLLAPAVSGRCGESLLSEKDVPSLQERDFADVAKRDDCVIMYYNSDSRQDDDAAKKTYGKTAQLLGDDWMAGLLAFQRQEGLSLKLYKVDWKGFSAESIDKVRIDTGSLYRKPESPSYVAYIDGGAKKFAVRGPARPDMSAWFVNEMLAHAIAVIKMDKGEFMRGRGWLITDTKAKYVNLTGMRKERIEVNGVSENVQIISYESSPYNGISCNYEGVFSGQGKLIGMNETCGKNPKTGYFDFDRTGKMQYRVRSSGTGTSPALHP